MKTDWLRVSFVTQIALMIYFQLVQWIPLGSWNYQPGFEPLIIRAIHRQLEIRDVAGVGIFALPVLLFWFARLKRITWLVWIGLLGYAAWLALEIQTWWIAYIFGASDAWLKIYQRVFSQSTKILPSFGRHLAPDGMHLFLQLLLAVIVISTSLALVELSRAKIRGKSQAE
jgi:hypothetical protein